MPGTVLDPGNRKAIKQRSNRESTFWRKLAMGWGVSSHLLLFINNTLFQIRIGAMKKRTVGLIQDSGRVGEGTLTTSQDQTEITTKL